RSACWLTEARCSGSRDYFDSVDARRPNGAMRDLSRLTSWLHIQRPALKPGFNDRNNHFYSSSFLRF
ncbi:MAG TPA: hypothetical protein VN956_17435, partial [Pyrinomonadaceae bacterium]|nr:hypothetical protein [Pyrinomonadaceae bacterium]